MKTSPLSISILTVCLIALMTFGISTQRSQAAGSPASATMTAQQERLKPQPDALSSRSTDSPLVGPVVVTATAGTTGPTDYATLKLAFDAINAGTHQGAITIDIVSSTSEGSNSAVLNSNAAAPASYTSVLIRPINDGVTISGASATGRGLIELNGADSVTIDGDNPNTSGTNRNLTIQNTAVSTTTYAQVIRIALATTVITSADNDTFKNLNVLGHATGRNNSGATSSTNTENLSYGIYASGGASTVSQTTAPSAIASTSTTIGSGATATNLTIQNNFVTTAARGIAIQGSATTVFPGLLIENNTVGNATAAAVDGVYSMGITLQGSTNAIVRGNTVYVESYVGASIRGIDFGGISATGSGATFEKNKIARVYGRSTSGFGAYGLNLVGGNSHIVRNNFVYDINAFFNNGSISTTFGPHGIRISTGTGHQVYNNSVNLFGAILGQSALSMASALTVTSSASTGMDIRNNILVNTITGAPAGTPVDCIALPSALTSTFNLTDNNNDYFSNLQLGQSGTTAVSGFTIAAFDPSTTAGATNWRSYTSTLLAANTNNDNASKKVDPLFSSNTDLHISSSSTMIDMAVAIGGVTDDIDSQVRPNGALPDIGADEFYAAPGTLQFSSASYSGNEGNMVTVTVSRVSGSSGTVGVTLTLNDGTATGGGACGAGVDFVNPGPQILSFGDSVVSQTINVQLCSDAVFDPGETFTATLSSPTGGATLGSPTVATVTITDIAPPFTGTVNVGTGQNYTSLTNPGGFFEALNNSGATGNVAINIISDLTGETGAVALNQVAGGFTVTIKPSGAARTISGTSTTTGLIKLNGADNVTIDGSTSGGLDRSLTITNGNLSATVIWIASASASDGANSNTVKNCIISGNTGATIIAGVLSGSGTTFGGAAETANSNNIIQNNQIFRVQNAAFLIGNGTTLDQNWLVTGNDWGSTVAADKLIFRGMLIGNAQNFIVSNNTIKGISSTIGTSSTMSGIQVALADNGGMVTGNKISDVKHNNTTGWGSNGIYLTSTSAAANVTVANNFISDVASQGFNGVLDTDNGYGIVVAAGGGGGYKIYFNSVLLNTNQGAGAASGITAGINVLTGVAAGAVDLRDNILASTQTLGTRYGALSSSAATVFSAINYNDYFAQNVGFIGGAAKPTLSDWQTATGQDANSKAVDPLFVSSTAPADLHLQSASTLRSMGLTIAGITTDIDNDPRPGSNPDIGADQFTCMFMLSRNHQSFPGNGGAGSVNVTGDASCMWTATTSATYIHITSGSPGMGNGTLNYTVDANPGPGIRSDTITIAGLTYTVYQGIDFLDVPSNHLFYTEIGMLAARGVTLGCTPDHTLYCPNDSVLREQMAAFILRAKGEFNPPLPGSQRFTDVPPANVFYNFIDRLAVLGITVGCNPPTNDMYCPGSAVTREQMSAFILRGLGEFSPPTPASQRFNDVPPANVFYNFIDRMAVLNITLGCTPDHLFYCPSDPVTRAQMAAFLVRAFDL